MKMLGFSRQVSSSSYWVSFVKEGVKDLRVQGLGCKVLGRLSWGLKELVFNFAITKMALTVDVW